ncbi:MAG: TerB family tellurite resistance protein [Myxococcales bacterium]|nr:TerB family tellurite resistance protein [Myxococcales bacterium]
MLMLSETIDTRLLYRLGFLMLAFGTVTDGELAPEELEAMAARLKKWIAPALGVSLVDVVEEAGRVYDMHRSDAGIRRTAYRYATVLGHALPLRARHEVIADLVAIAEADEVICEGEVSFLSMVMRAFGVRGRNPLRGRAPALYPAPAASSSSSGMRTP